MSKALFSLILNLILEQLGKRLGGGALMSLPPVPDHEVEEIRADIPQPMLAEGEDEKEALTVETLEGAVHAVFDYLEKNAGGSFLAKTVLSMARGAVLSGLQELLASVKERLA